MQYIIARYYFDSLFRENANKSFLDDLKKEPFVDVDVHTYALGDFKSIEYQGNHFLRGTFGKIIKEDLSKTYNKEKQEFIDSPVSNKVLDTIEFFIHHDTHLIFIQKSSKITHATFKNKFVLIYDRNSEFSSSFRIDFVSDEKDIYETIKTWDRLIRANFKGLRASNPSADDTFEHIDALIKETGGDTTDLNFQNERKNNHRRDSGLNPDSMLIKEALSLSAHGYGEAKLEGTKDKEFVCVGTKKMVRKVEINFDDDGALKGFVKVIEEIQKYEKPDA